MQKQPQLVHESINDALREVIMSAGGYKKVGTMMFPEMAVEHAAGKLRDCLNRDRRERFTPEQFMMIARLGRQVGCHALIAYMSREAGYADPVPVEPEDEVARLQREFIEATAKLGQMASRIEQINQTMIRRVA